MVRLRGRLRSQKTDLAKEIYRREYNKQYGKLAMERLKAKAKADAAKRVSGSRGKGVAQTVGSKAWKFLSAPPKKKQTQRPRQKVYVVPGPYQQPYPGQYYMPGRYVVRTRRRRKPKPKPKIRWI